MFGELAVRTNSPIDVAPEDNPTSEPEPGVCVTAWTLGERPGAIPVPRDIVLLVEVSDTTLSFDINEKAALYARAGIADYWVVDVNKRRMIVHRSPSEGAYQSLTVYSDVEPVSPLAAPHSSVRLASFGG